MATAGFEELLNDTIQSKTGEKVYLDLAKENVVQLRPLCRQGSIPLGLFWVHVFQHPNNYPVCSYPYKKLYKAGSEYDLQLRIDGICVTINLATGYLTFKGSHVIDWFVSRMPTLLQDYSLPPTKVSKELREQYTQEEMEALQKQRERNYRHYLEDWPLKALERAANVMEAGRKRIDYEPIDPEGFLKGQDLETYNPTADLMDEEEVTQQLHKLESGRVIQGNVLYRLWRSTLDSWFSNKDARVFIITPHIDCDRLTDLCTLFLKNKLTAHLETVCVPLSNLYSRFAEVRREAIKRFPAKDQVFIEYKIYNKVVYPVIGIQTSFIANVKDGKARILQTNTNFDRASFITAASATVTYKEVDEGEFLEAYLDPVLV